MSKVRVCFLLLLSIVILCGCAKETDPIEVLPETTAVPETIPTAAEIVQPPVTEPTATIPPTQPPRVIGPEIAEGNAVTVQDVSVEYIDQLPQSIKSTTTYSTCGFKEELVLNESQVYAVIRFRITNKADKEMEIADIHDDFLVELVYDNRYVYSPDTGAWCFFQAGAQTAVVSDNASIGKVKLSPLSDADVTAYIPCAKEVSTETDKYLSVVFSSCYSGYESLEFIIR